MPRHVRQGDTVMITSGAFRGAVGEIARVLTKVDRVVVQFPASVYDGEKRRQLVKNRKPTRINPQGGRVELDRSFPLSNVSPVADGKPTRVRFETRADGSKVRVAARNGKELGVLHGPREGGAAKGAAAPAKKKTTKKKAAKPAAKKSAKKASTKKTSKKPAASKTTKSTKKAPARRTAKSPSSES